jgi:hypothetical protein
MPTLKNRDFSNEQPNDTPQASRKNEKKPNPKLTDRDKIRANINEIETKKKKNYTKNQ